MNTWEILAVIFSLICVLLTIKENIWQWLFGIIGVLFYFIVFYQAKLYANMWLQIVFEVLQIYGWYQWLHGGKDNGELEISRSPAKVNLLLLLIGLVGTASLTYYFQIYTDNPMPLADTAATVLSLLAQWMLAKKYLENWLVWIAVNVITIILGVARELYLTAGLYVLLFILAILGWNEWLKTYRTLRALSMQTSAGKV
jgi:nicotinamide mononucleotide transporter